MTVIVFEHAPSGDAAAAHGWISAMLEQKKPMTRRMNGLRNRLNLGVTGQVFMMIFPPLHKGMRRIGRKPVIKVPLSSPGDPSQEEG
jgi:hypothetical protein